MARTGRLRGWLGLTALALGIAGAWHLRERRDLSARAQATDREPAVSPSAPQAAPPPMQPAPQTSPAPTAAASPDTALPQDVASMPPPSPDQVMPRPTQRKSTPAEELQTQRDALSLLNRSLARLESERQRAGSAQEPELARRDAVRIERLRKRRDTLQRQLETP